MSDLKHTVETLQSLDPQKVAEVSGGTCTVSDIEQALENIKESYETLIDFAGYVIERVAGK